MSSGGETSKTEYSHCVAGENPRHSVVAVPCSCRYFSAHMRFATQRLVGHGQVFLERAHTIVLRVRVRFGWTVCYSRMCVRVSRVALPGFRIICVFWSRSMIDNIDVIDIDSKSYTIYCIMRELPIYFEFPLFTNEYHSLVGKFIHALNRSLSFSKASNSLRRMGLERKIASAGQNYLF